MREVARIRKPAQPAQPARKLHANLPHLPHLRTLSRASASSPSSLRLLAFCSPYPAPYLPSPPCPRYHPPLLGTLSFSYPPSVCHAPFSPSHARGGPHRSPRSSLAPSAGPDCAPPALSSPSRVREIIASLSLPLPPSTHPRYNLPSNTVCLLSARRACPFLASPPSPSPVPPPFLPWRLLSLHACCPCCPPLRRRHSSYRYLFD